MEDSQRPMPIINGDNQGFWAGCREKELRFQKCIRCGHIRWPAAILCPECHSLDFDWVTSTGRGRVYTYVVYWKAFHPAFRDEVPYVVAVVELDEGPRLLTNVVGCLPEEVHCDMPVEVTWDDVAEGVRLPKFRPLGATDPLGRQDT